MGCCHAVLVWLLISRKSTSVAAFVMNLTYPTVAVGIQSIPVGPGSTESRAYGIPTPGKGVLKSTLVLTCRSLGAQCSARKSI